MCKKKILIIEDEFNDYKALAEILVENHYEVIPYYNRTRNDFSEITDAFHTNGEGIENYAIRKIQENHKDLKMVICDLFFDGYAINGDEVISAISKFKAKNEKIKDIRLLPIIALTRKTEFDRSALMAGVNFILRKSEDRDIMKRTIIQQIKIFEETLNYIEASVIPAKIREEVKTFKEKHKDKKTAFIMSSFSEDKHKPIIDKIKDILAYHNIEGIVADNKILYADNVNDQLSIHLHGCDFGIGVLTNLDTADTMTEELRKKYGFNPNLLIECGYMYGLDKDVCLLKESNAANPPSDWQGLIWKPFNNDNLDSLKTPLEEWLRSFGYIK